MQSLHDVLCLIYWGSSCNILNHKLFGDILATFQVKKELFMKLKRGIYFLIFFTDTIPLILVSE